MAYDPGGDMQAVVIQRAEKKTEPEQQEDVIICQKCREFEESPKLVKGDLVIIVSNTNPENAINLYGSNALYKPRIGVQCKLESSFNGDETILISGFPFKRGIRLQKLCSRCGEPIGEVVEF